MRLLLFVCLISVLLSCSNQNADKMNEPESDQIIKELKTTSSELTKYSETAQLDSFLNYYDNSPSFLHFSSDGKMRNFEEFKKICAEYYSILNEQKISTTRKEFNVVDSNLVISAWTGNIVAHFKNGDTMIMNNYSISNLFKKINGKWKIIHSHESALPPDIIKKQ